jgi:hypothetical protein
MIRLYYILMIPVALFAFWQIDRRWRAQHR